MEKQSDSKKKTILKLLPKAAAAAAAVFLFQNAPFSPGRERKLNHLHHKGPHGGPILSIIPSNLSSGRKSEPNSPKISCIGQIKHNKKKKMLKCNSTTSKSQQQHVVVVKKKKSSVSNIGNIFSGKTKLIPGRKSAENIKNSRVDPNRAPCLSHMKRFASGREPLTDFDWRSIQIITPQDHRRYYNTDDDDEDEDQEFNINAGPILFRSTTNISLEPRKEINLWKRRTMNQPKPLQLNNSASVR